MKPPRPVCLTLLFCERAVVREDRRFDLIGVFNQVVPTAFPFRLTCVVHFALIEGQGDYDVELSIEDDLRETLMASAVKRISLRTPMVVHEEPVSLEATIPGPGGYTVRLRANGEMIASRAFAVLA